jgi:hypothetical protein
VRPSGEIRRPWSGLAAVEAGFEDRVAAVGGVPDLDPPGGDAADLHDQHAPALVDFESFVLVPAHPALKETHHLRVPGIRHIEDSHAGELRALLHRRDGRLERLSDHADIGALTQPGELEVRPSPADVVLADEGQVAAVALPRPAASLICQRDLALQPGLGPGVGPAVLGFDLRRRRARCDGSVHRRGSGRGEDECGKDEDEAAAGHQMLADRSQRRRTSAPIAPQGCAWARTGGMADLSSSSVTVNPALHTGASSSDSAARNS